MCSADVTQGGDGLLTWPQTEVGESAFSDEICPLGTSKGNKMNIITLREQYLLKGIQSSIPIGLGNRIIDNNV